MGPFLLAGIEHFRTKQDLVNDHLHGKPGLLALVAQRSHENRDGFGPEGCVWFLCQAFLGCICAFFSFSNSWLCLPPPPNPTSKIFPNSYIAPPKRLVHSLSANALSTKGFTLDKQAYCGFPAWKYIGLPLTVPHLCVYIYIYCVLHCIALYIHMNIYIYIYAICRYTYVLHT